MPMASPAIPFFDRLAAAIQAKRSPLMVGLDPRRQQLPDGLRPADNASLADVADAYRAHSCGVIDAVADLTAIVKPQAAFFEQLGPAGMTALAAVIDHAHAAGLLVSPYLGDDSLEPFTKVAAERGCGVFILVKTSNPGSGLFQDQHSGGQPLYRQVGDYVESIAKESLGECGYGVAGAVVGATYPEQLAKLRAFMPHTWFLVPGFGAQGGAATDVAGGFDSKGLGAVVNSSRGVIFAYEKRPHADGWQAAVRVAAEEAVQQLREVMPG
jgi:orotidine-5'-phosphate decarboxylase